MLRWAERVSGGVCAADLVLAVGVYQNRDRLVALGQGIEVPPDTTSESSTACSSYF